METLTVELGSRSYPIHIGSGILGRMELLLPHLAQPKVAVVTNETVAPLLLKAYARRLREEGCQVVEIVLPDGEQFKDWLTLNKIFDALIEHSCERKTTLVALGGGVVGDMTGFAAACFQRGAPFIQIPTTLLAQVDSSVGGKTAINHPSGKNMIGAFHQPQLVLIDPDTLRSLPERELRAGLAEVIKYGLIRDLPFLEWLEQNIEKLLAKEPDVLEQAIYRSCRNKAEVVAADEREHGERALLNLGHTFGHAIEAATGYSDRLLHGEGVAIGCALAFELSQRLGLCSQEAPSRVRAHLREMKMKVDLSDIQCELPDTDGLIELMGQDKKVLDGKLRFILARGIGEAFVTSDVPRDVLKTVLDEALAARG